MLKIGALFHRKDSTGWSVKEFDAFKEAALAENIGDCDEEIDRVVEYYSAPVSFLRDHWNVCGTEQDFRCRETLTLLRKWPGQVSKARRFLAWDAERRERDRRLRDGDPAGYGPADHFPS
jgi:hypothetical protein